MIEISAHYREKISNDGLKDSELIEILDSDDIDFYLDFLQLQGLGLDNKGNHYYPRQLFQNINETKFCIVDIETNGSNPHKNQIIELGAVMIQNGKVIDTFNSLINADILPTSIERLTGITLLELQKAPPLKEVMHQFKSFIKDEILVAHPLKFDYNFLSESFEKVHLGSMLNIGICSISLTERTLSSAKYGLSYLNETLNLQDDFEQHRAYNDAVITKRIFIKALHALPDEIQTIKELLKFIREAKKQPRAALLL